MVNECAAPDLDVIFDSTPRFDDQIKCVVKSCFLQLKTCKNEVFFLSVADLDHTCVSSRLNYCNALYLGVSQSLI